MKCQAPNSYVVVCLPMMALGAAAGPFGTDKNQVEGSDGDMRIRGAGEREEVCEWTNATQAPEMTRGKV